MIVLKNSNVFDGVSETLKKNCSVLLEGDKIKEVREQDKTTYENCEVIDLGGRVLMPGLIECHMHVLQCEIPEPDKCMNDRTPGGDRLENTDAYVCFRGVYSCRRMLDAGFTTVFDGGGNNFMEAALRECINTGLFDAPDYYICGLQITAGRGHLPGIGYEAHGEWGIREAVRKMLWWGANHIKIKMSAPMRMPGRNTERSEYTVPEIKAACEEAHSAGLLVSGHARGAIPIKDFLEGGGDRIVHGTGIDDEGIEMILKRNQYVYPTLCAPYYECTDTAKAIKPKKTIDALLKKGREHFESVKKMYKAGVKFAFASDSGAMDMWPGINCFNEMLHMREIGMSNIGILRAATSEAAKAVGLESLVGAVKPGMRANLIVVEKNPVQENIEQMQEVKMVIKAGRIVRNKLPIAISF
ncbi:MAG: amidohydrolase family protein [Spirochaetales bacterium]|jgi:imidazolonepropionase-like amidohydrolase|nr:amidohydrolase family protein [Spirochaetales bacterium]